jgi:hypothetical protein
MGVTSFDDRWNSIASASSFNLFGVPESAKSRTTDQEPPVSPPGAMVER